MQIENRISIIKRRISDLEQRSEENGDHVYQLRDDILSGKISQSEFTARLDRVREVHSSLRVELDALAREAGALRGAITS
jgi:chromosome segregation ATPase